MYPLVIGALGLRPRKADEELGSWCRRHEGPSQRERAQRPVRHSPAEHPVSSPRRETTPPAAYLARAGNPALVSAATIFAPVVCRVSYCTTASLRAFETAAIFVPFTA